MTNQTDKRAIILNWMKSGKSITKRQSTIDFDLINLGDVIHIFRKRGYNIIRTWMYSKDSKYASYRLEQ